MASSAGTGGLSDSAARPAPVTMLQADSLQCIMAKLPADERARSAAVCPSWRAAASLSSLWTSVDLSRSGGLTCASVSPALLLQRSALAPRLAQLRELRVQGSAEGEHVHAFSSADALRGVLRLVRDRNAPALRVLRFAGAFSLTDAESEPLLRALLNEAPNLVVEVEELTCAATLAVSLLSHPRLRVLQLDWHAEAWPPPDNAATQATQEQLCCAMEQHDAFEALTVHISISAATLARIVDIARERRWVALMLHGDPPHNCVEQLARLLREVPLRRLTLELPFHEDAVFDDDGAALFADALRASSTLEELILSSTSLFFCGEASAGTTLFAALVGHPSIASVQLWEHTDKNYGNNVRLLEGYRAFDESLEALVRADAPALKKLRVHVNLLIGDGRPLLMLPLTFTALAHNAHLRMLDVGLLAPRLDFMRVAMLPGLMANKSLRELGFAFHATKGADEERALNDLRALMY